MEAADIEGSQRYLVAAELMKSAFSIVQRRLLLVIELHHDIAYSAEERGLRASPGS